MPTPHIRIDDLMPLEEGSGVQTVEEFAAATLLQPVNTGTWHTRFEEVLEPDVTLANNCLIVEPPLANRWFRRER